jgi:hypothetical protein
VENNEYCFGKNHFAKNRSNVLRSRTSSTSLSNDASSVNPRLSRLQACSRVGIVPFRTLAVWNLSVLEATRLGRVKIKGTTRLITGGDLLGACLLVR